ncbi:methionine biosynthesis protein MetW [Cupriavidus basilensis]
MRKLAPYEDWIAAVREQALGPVLDVGCGRGEWLELALGARGVPARGVDLNGAMVELCRGHGLGGRTHGCRGGAGAGGGWHAGSGDRFSYRGAPAIRGAPTN